MPAIHHVEYEHGIGPVHVGPLTVVPRLEWGRKVGDPVEMKEAGYGTQIYLKEDLNNSGEFLECRLLGVIYRDQPDVIDIAVPVSGYSFIVLRSVSGEAINADRDLRRKLVYI